MDPNMLPQDLPQYFDRVMVIRGVEVLLRVFPLNNTFVFQTSRPMSDIEKQKFANYMKVEGFLDGSIESDPPPLTV